MMTMPYARCAGDCHREPDCHDLAFGKGKTDALLDRGEGRREHGADSPLRQRRGAMVVPRISASATPRHPAIAKSNCCGQDAEPVAHQPTAPR